MSLLFIQHGDYAEAYTRFAAGGVETYRDQKKSVDFVSDLAADQPVTTIALGDTDDLAELAPNLRAGSLARATLSRQKIAELFDTIAPTHVILRSPHLGILHEATRRGCKVLPSFADIFHRGGPRQRWRNFRLRRALAHPAIPCVANHSLNASQSLASAVGVPLGRIVPWDWSRIPAAEPAKTSVADRDAPTAFYAGVLSEAKGVGDILEALRLCRDQGHKVSVTFAGRGDQAAWEQRADQLGVADQIRFVGLIPNTEVRNQMRAHDMVIVPSRHSYPEGLPNTIYEALASRSALVLSDHPAFAGRLAHDSQCLTFKAQDPRDLARCLSRLCTDDALYTALSQNADAAADGLYVGLDWCDLVTQFLADPDNHTGWVTRHSLLEAQQTQ